MTSGGEGGGGEGRKLLFVYGTLRRNEVNYFYWLSSSSPKSSRFIETATTIDKYPFFLNSAERGWSPCVVDAPGEGLPVEGDLFDVSAEVAASIDLLEGVHKGVYTPAEISVCGATTGEVKKAWIYFRTGNCIEYKKENGDGNPEQPPKLFASFSARDSCYTHPNFDYIPVHLKRNTTLPAPPLRPKPMLLVILDGVGDVSMPGRHCATPLSVAAEESPGLNLLAKNGCSGMMHPFKSGHGCGSDTAHLSMLGYDPRLFYRGRGAFESLGAGMVMGDSDIAFKCNFSTLDTATNVVLRRRCDRNFTAEGPVLCEALNGLTVRHGTDGERLAHGPHTVRVQYATEHRCGLVITGPGLSDLISGTDPLSDGKHLVRCVPRVTGTDAGSTSSNAVAEYTCHVVEAASRAIHEVLASHPINAQRAADGKPVANIVLLRGAAMRGDVPSFLTRHGLRSFIVAPTCIIRGLGMSCGMEGFTCEGATGDVHSDYTAKARKTIELLRTGDYEFGVMHIKGVDDAGHEKDHALKARLLVDAGRAMELLWAEAPEGTTIAVTADHSTPCVLGDHCVEPVPFSVATVPPDEKNEKEVADKDSNHDVLPPCDDVGLFDEFHCAMGGRAGLGCFRGEDMLEVMKRYHYAHHWLS